MSKTLSLILISLLFLTACEASPAEGSTSNIGLGMNKEEVTDILGDPDYRTTDRNELSAEYNTLTTIHGVDVELTDEPEYDVYERMGLLSNAIEEQQNLEVFDYELTEGYKIIIYFIDNEVVHFYEIDLSE